MKNYAIYLLLPALLLSCEKVATENNAGTAVVIDISQSQEETIATYIDSVQFIPLQTTDDNLIHYVTKVYFDDQLLIVTDTQEKQVLLFRKDGTFIRKIKNVGQGPGEYANMTCVFYDAVNKHILVYDGTQKKMIYYTEEGTVVKETTPFSDHALIRDMIHLSNGHFLCYAPDYTPTVVGEKASGLWEVDANGKFIRSVFTTEELYPVMLSFSNSFFQTLPDNKVMLRDAQFNDIYYWENDTLQKIITHQIKNDVLPSLKGSHISEENFTKSLTAQEKGEYIFLIWMDFAERFYTVYNKKSHENILVYPANSFWQSVDVVKPSDFWFVDNNRFDVLITSLSGEAITDYLNATDTNPDIKDKLKEITKGMSERDIIDMNPVLQLLYVKI